MSEPPRRFFVPRGSVRARNVTLGPDMAHRLGRVLRLRRGDRVILAEGGLREYEAQITGISGHAVTALVVAEREAPPEPDLKLSLYQSLIRANRFDLVLEKCTEVGISRFVPIVAARSQVQADGEGATSRTERWQRIITEAAEQCGRGRPPPVDAPVPFEEALTQARGLKLLPWEGERGRSLRGYLAGMAERPRAVSLFIGPEGGFEPAEIELGRSQGVALVSLGPRILRSETAAIVASALVLDALGEMG